MIDFDNIELDEEEVDDLVIWFSDNEPSRYEDYIWEYGYYGDDIYSLWSMILSNMSTWAGYDKESLTQLGVALARKYHEWSNINDGVSNGYLKGVRATERFAKEHLNEDDWEYFDWFVGGEL